MQCVKQKEKANDQRRRKTTKVKKKKISNIAPVALEGHLRHKQGHLQVLAESVFDSVSESEKCNRIKCKNKIER